MTKALAGFVSLLCVGFVAGFMLTGCETDSGSSLTVHPARIEMSGSDNMQVFLASGPITVDTNSASATTPESSGDTAGDEPLEDLDTVGGGFGALAFPLEWSVSDPSLGAIIESSGRRAAYVRTSRAGMNIVTVRDQYGSEGFAVVEQH